MRRLFGMQVHFIRWTVFSLGVSVDVATPNIEIHLPFGFVLIGWRWIDRPEPRVIVTTFSRIEAENWGICGTTTTASSK